jgi:hypothetical protein
MSKEGIRKHWDLVEAWKNGAEIEYSISNGVWKNATSPAWSLHTEYRIKPELKTVPFTIEDAELLIGKIVTRKGYKSCAMIIAVYEPYVVIANEQVKYDDLLLHYVFTDNTPCGKIEEI